MLLEDLLDTNLLAKHVSEGFVSAKMDPTQEYAIYNYTAAAQYDRLWDDVTKQCRGLIVHIDTGEVVARPFRKFFNLSEHSRSDVMFSKPFVTFDKADGSLLILADHRLNDRVVTATRGSFESEQAQYGRDMLQANYGGWVPPQNHTALFEVIYPENRIVVDYGGESKLVLLAVVDNETGLDTDELYGWTGPTIGTFDISIKPRDILDNHSREGVEGYVLRFDYKGGHVRVKIKEDEYVRLHKILTNFSSRTVWQIIKDGEDLMEFLDAVPDEFYLWARTTEELLRGRVADLIDDAEVLWDKRPQGPLTNRKELALYFQDQEDTRLTKMCFMLLDDKRDRLLDYAWQCAYPPHELPWNGTPETKEG